MTERGLDVQHHAANLVRAEVVKRQESRSLPATFLVEQCELLNAASYMCPC